MAEATPERDSQDLPNLLEEMSEQARSCVEPLLDNEEMLAAAYSDIVPDGSYGETWVVVTKTRLIAFRPEGPPGDLTISIPLRDIEAVEIRDLRGNSMLKVRTADAGFELARFSMAQRRKLSVLVAVIEDFINSERPDAPVNGNGARRGTYHAEWQTCPQCGRPMPTRATRCLYCVDKGKTLRRLLKFVIPYWRPTLLALLLLVVATFVSLTPPLLMQRLVDDVLVPASVQETPTSIFTEHGPEDPFRQTDSFVQSDGPSKLHVIVLLLLLVTMSSNLLRAARGYIMAWIGQSITHDLRSQLYAHVHKLSLSFFSREETGRIMSRITRDIRMLQEFVGDGLQEWIHNILQLVLISAIMFFMNWKLALVVLIPTPILFATTLYFGHRLHTVYHTMSRLAAGLSALLADTIPGVRVVKAFSQEQREVNKFAERSEQVRRGSLKASMIRMSFLPIMGFITYLGTILIWWVGGHKVLSGVLTLGQFMAFSRYMMRFYQPVESLCRLNHMMQHALASSERVFEIFDTEPDIEDSPKALELPDVKGHVCFHNVDFSYEPGKLALSNVSFEVQPGEMIGLVGHSGAGKSTIINLICRFYDPVDGAITIDGIDLRDVKTQSLRRQLGLVLQEPFMFNGSIAENIAYGKPNCSMAEIITAAKAAACHDFIMASPECYDTQVGERGQALSGGERQRLAIARAILKDPKVLILDEATSSVDTKTESQIQEALGNLVRGRTTIAIAHRLSTLKHADRLVVLDHGSVAEVGTHQQLLDADGIYAHLCKVQEEMSKIRKW